MNGHSPSADVTYRCGTVDIDAAQRSVVIDGAPVKVGARAFDVLLALVERRERVVPKRELMDVVWPNVVVEEGNLLVHIVALRKVLGPRAIATIPGRGYRFVMPVDVVEGTGPRESPAPPAAVQGNVPASPTLFGRADDLEAIDVLLREHAVVTIVGAGGIGKTRVALRVASTTRVEWPDGRWWVELASVMEGAQLPNSIAAALGIALPSGAPNEALATALSGRNLLLVLDNCEQLADDIAALIDLLRVRAPRVHALLTSQELLKCRDEQVYRLGPLAVPATAQLEDAVQFGAVALFVERAHAVDSRFQLAADNVDAVVDLCRRLDGIPLAIELAAARVPLLGVHGLHARLHEMFNVLTGGTRMKLRRHQTLRAALEWSYGLLSSDEQTAFRRLGVFAGGFTLELAQDVVTDTAIDRWLVLDLLAHLIDKSLVIADAGAEPRYHLLDTTRAFALERLAMAGESAAMLQRHAQAMCALMAATDANCWNLSPAERRRAVQELGNLRAAVDWTMAAPEGTTLRYELLAGCWIVWMHNGVIAEGVQRMLKLWPVASGLPPSVEADFCLALARLNAGCGAEEQWQAAARAEALYGDLGDTERRGDALLLMGTIGLARNHIAEAARALDEAKQWVGADAALRKQAALAATEGEHHMRVGAPERAIDAFRRQGELYRRAGAEIGEYLALGNVGSAKLLAGEVDSAIDCLRRAVDGLRRIRAPYGHEHRLGMLSLALALRGAEVEVPAVAREAFDSLRSLGTTSVPLLASALYHAQREDLARAVMVAGHALATLSRRGGELHSFCVKLQERVHERAQSRYPADAVEAWARAGGALTEDRAAAIAFDDAPLEVADVTPAARP
jgi:predicted ATPase/DNA-binding winged helix-turn-helix (wHTH) protein